MDGYLRLGYGERPDYLQAGFGRLHELLTSLPDAPSRGQAVSKAGG
jgi:hypothetical protein